MLDRTKQPQVCDFEAITLTPPTRLQLPNGIVCKIFGNCNLDLIHLSIKIKAGALYELQKRLASFCYKLLRESHKEMTANEVDAFLDYYGAAVNVVAGVNFITINVLIPKRNCAKVVPFVADLLAEPAFSADNLEVLREKLRKDWEYQSQKVGNRASQLMFNAFCGGQVPFGKLLESSDFDKITLSQIGEYHHQTCCAENIRLFVAGNVDAELQTLLSDHFGRIRNHCEQPDSPLTFSNFQPRRIAESWPQSLQTALLLCAPGIPANHPDRLKFRFMQTLFCNYFGSRLMQNLRERNGFTYGIFGTMSPCGKEAIFYIDSEVNNDKAEAAVQECFAEMRLLREELPSEEEMTTVRNYMLGTALRDIDGTVSYMLSYADWDDAGEDENRFHRHIDTVKTITAEDVNSLANKYLREERFAVVEVGNFN